MTRAAQYIYQEILIMRNNITDKKVFKLIFPELLVKEPRQRMTAAEAQGHRWVRKDFDVHDGPKYKVQTVKMRRYKTIEREVNI